MTKAAKHIAFDWNGTLLDDTDAVFVATNAFLAAAKRAPIDRATFHDHYAIPLSQFYRNLGLDEEAVQCLLKDSNGTFHDHYEARAATAPLRKGADEILAHAHAANVTSIIFSNHIVGPIRAQLQRHGIEAFFADVVAFASRAQQFQGLTKAERLRQYREKNGIAGQDVIIVGDTNEEIHIAREQGLVSVAITGGCISEARLAAEKPDYLIHSLHELKPILQERGFVS
jgi:phosphoglycolate phosphatase